MLVYIKECKLITAPFIVSDLERFIAGAMNCWFEQLLLQYKLNDYLQVVDFFSSKSYTTVQVRKCFHKQVKSQIASQSPGPHPSVLKHMIEK